MEGEVDTGRGEPTVHRALSGYKGVGGPTKSPSTGIMKPTWKPSSKPNEKTNGKEVKELIKVDFSYGSFHSDDFTEPMPQTDILVVKQIVDGVGKRAGNWKENFEAAFIPATAKVRHTRTNLESL